MTTFNIVAGQYKDINLTTLDENSAVLPIERVYLTVKKDSLQSDANAVIQKNSHTDLGAPQTAQIEITDDTGGIAIIKFIPTDTNTLSPGRYVYDIWVRVLSASEILVPVVQNSVFNIQTPITERTLL